MGAFGTIAASILQPILGEIGAKRQQKRERENVEHQTQQNIELAKYSFGENLAQWERQNLYNTPSAQMARFKEAGLNPNLIYGQGTAGNAASSPQYQTTRAEKAAAITPQHNPLTMLAQYQQIRQANAQTDLTQQTANVERGKAIQMDFLNKGITKTQSDTGEFGEQRLTTVQTTRFKEKTDYELAKTQSVANQAQSDAILKKLEADLYKKMGIGGGAVGQILKALFMFKR